MTFNLSVSPAAYDIYIFTIYLIEEFMHDSQISLFKNIKFNQDIFIKTGWLTVEMTYFSFLKKIITFN